MTDYEAYAAAVDAVVKEWGRLDILVNNAAIIFYGTILEDTLEHWRLQIRTNLEAYYMGSKLVAPHMVRQKAGRIISISSVEAFATGGTIGAYDAAKGGINALTKSMAVELAPYNIQVNAVAPGFLRTPMAYVNGVDVTDDEFFHTWYVGQPQGADGAHRFSGRYVWSGRVFRFGLLPIYDRSGAGCRRRPVEHVLTDPRAKRARRLPSKGGGYKNRHEKVSFTFTCSENDRPIGLVNQMLEENMSKKLYVVLSALLLASMLLAACGGAATPAPTEAPAAATEAPAAEMTEAPAAATEAPAAATEASCSYRSACSRCNLCEDCQLRVQR